MNKNEGIQLIKGSLEKNPNYTSAWNKLGKIMEEKVDDSDNKQKREKTLELSKKFYDKSLSIDPDNFQGRIGLATYYYKLKEYTKCDSELNKIVLPSEANDVRCLKLKADNYFAMEKYEIALDIYLKCRHADTSFKDEVQMGIGNCYYTLDDYDNATATFKELEEKCPTNIDIKIKLAACYMMRQLSREAIKMFEDCRRLQPYNWQICLYLARIYMHIENYADAAEMIKTYNENNPDEIQGHLKLAEMYELLGAHQSALEELLVNCCLT